MSQRLCGNLGTEGFKVPWLSPRAVYHTAAAAAAPTVDCVAESNNNN